MASLTLEVQLTREYLMRQREAYLAMVDAIECILEIEPRTAEIRRAEKRERAGVHIKIEEKEKV